MSDLTGYGWFVHVKRLTGNIFGIRKLTDHILQPKSVLQCIIL